MGCGPAALACLLRAVGLFRVDTGDGQPMACLACCMLGVPGQEWEGSWSPAELRVRVEELAMVEEDAGEVERVTSAPSLRGCSWRMESCEGGDKQDGVTRRFGRGRLQPKAAPRVGNAHNDFHKILRSVA